MLNTKASIDKKWYLIKFIVSEMTMFFIITKDITNIVHVNKNLKFNRWITMEIIIFATRNEHSKVSRRQSFSKNNRNFLKKKKE